VLLPLLGFSQVQPLEAIVHANEDNPMLLHIRFNNYTGEYAWVTIKNNKNTFVYKKCFWSSTKQGNIKFYTAGMPNGVYTITVHTKDIRYVKKVDISTLYKSEHKQIATLE
jgi:hypothetical protein